ncbi:hypothetical protein IHE45_11G061600 [Dioscorea alata]|uniref:Uncharacterized protein n=1 Tax=Dioscorea alata TaxID=55571 RepID=A0ACB7V713_DIOAL|nr:hypothetical protein IHE45_11G061600 [Dioscorea alata]
MFLAGVNAGFDDVKGRVLDRRPFPSIREVFSELGQEEGQRQVMSRHSSQPAELEGSALAAHGIDAASDRKKKPWCEHCKQHWHTKESCWKLHGKPQNWQPNWKKKQERGRALNTV